MAHRYQRSDTSCAVAAMCMAFEEVGLPVPTEEALADELGTDLQGTRNQAMVEAVQRRGLDHTAWYGDVTIGDLRELIADHAVIVCYQAPRLGVGHFAMVEHVTADEVQLADPWFGPGTCLALDEFLATWRSEPPGAKVNPRWLLAIRRPTHH